MQVCADVDRVEPLREAANVVKIIVDDVWFHLGHRVKIDDKVKHPRRKAVKVLRKDPDEIEVLLQLRVQVTMGLWVVEDQLRVTY